MRPTTWSGAADALPPSVPPHSDALSFPSAASAPMDDHALALQFASDHPDAFAARLLGCKAYSWNRLYRELTLEVWSFLGTQRLSNLTVLQWTARINSLYQKTLLDDPTLEFESADIDIGGIRLHTHIQEQAFVRKMANALASDVPDIFRQHCYHSARQIAFAVMGPISEDSVALASSLTRWNGCSGFTMFHESGDRTLDFNGTALKQILHLAFRSSPTSPTFMGVFHRVTNPDGSERFERIRQCGIFAMSWALSNFAIHASQTYPRGPTSTRYNGRVTSTRRDDIKDSFSRTLDFLETILYCSLPICPLGCCQDTRHALSHVQRLN